MFALILIGSRALALEAPGLLDREPKDWDLIGNGYEAWLEKHLPDATVEDLPKGKKVARDGASIVEFELTEDSSPGREFEQFAIENGRLTAFGVVPCLDLLFALKQSHRHLKNSPHFWKNWRDWHRMRAAGAKVREEHKSWLKAREKETYGYKHPSLMQSKKDFFADDNIQYQYDHDSIHRAVALGARPAYTFFQKDGAEVACDRTKFEACPMEVRINSVLEESAVLAIERSLVPHPGVLTARQAWLLAYSKVCTSIASGWWRQFAYEAGPQILKRYDEHYFDRFQEGLRTGVVVNA